MKNKWSSKVNVFEYVDLVLNLAQKEGIFKPSQYNYTRKLFIKEVIEGGLIPIVLEKDHFVTEIENKIMSVKKNFAVPVNYSCFQKSFLELFQEKRSSKIIHYLEKKSNLIVIFLTGLSLIFTIVATFVK